MSNVTSKTIDQQGQSATRHPSQVVDQGALRGTDRWLDWLIWLILFLITTIGNVGFFGVDITEWTAWTYWQDRWQAPAVLGLLVGVFVAVAAFLRAWGASWRVSLAIALLAYGVGVYLALTESRIPVAARWLLAAMAAALLMQSVIQWRQWANAHNKRGWRYLTALAFSVVPSWWTYLPIAVPWLTAAVLGVSVVLLDLWWFVITSYWIGYGLFGLGLAILLVLADVLQELMVVKTR